MEKLSDANPMGYQSTVGNNMPSIAPLTQSVDTGYQPSTMMGQVPQNLNAPIQTEGNSVYAPAPRRRRAGDSPKNEEPSGSLYGGRAESKLSAADPFAKYDNYKPSYQPSSMSKPDDGGMSQAPTKKPLTYEDKLKLEASKGSFLDMIGGGGASKGPAVAVKNE